MTYNIGEGRNDFGSNLNQIMAIIKDVAPDILAVQETAVWQDLDGNLHSTAKEIANSLNYEYSYFGPTISMREQFHVDKPLFVKWLFEDWQDWWQGNSLLSHWPFLRLGDPSQQGEPQNIPLYRPAQYEGYRDTESRFVIVTRIGHTSIQPFVLTTHFTTLIGERGGEKREIPGKSAEAQKVRWEQSRRLVDLIQYHLLDKGELVFLMGDFNAEDSEPSISYMLEQKGGFTLLLPEKKRPTHLKVQSPVDHILVYPGNRRIEYKCWVVDDKFNASDHNPVVADVAVYDTHSARFQEFGPGVARMKK